MGGAKLLMASDIDDGKIMQTQPTSSIVRVGKNQAINSVLGWKIELLGLVVVA